MYCTNTLRVKTYANFFSLPECGEGRVVPPRRPRRLVMQFVGLSPDPAQGQKTAAQGLPPSEFTKVGGVPCHSWRCLVLSL